jgi:HSP20 family protein
MTTFTRLDPFQRIAHGQRETDRVLGRTLPARHHQDVVSWVPSADIEPSEDAIVFKLDLPSTSKDDVSIEVHGRTLTFSAQRHAETDDKLGGHRVGKRPDACLDRSFLLPDDIDTGDVTAAFEHGQLMVSVPRPKIDTPRKMMITTS